MMVTISICTWNRAELLDRCLDQFTRMAVPRGIDWELIVVNNNCSDHTDQILQKYSARIPLRRILERSQGKSFALNTAIRQTRGELILWTDDDVLVDEDWLVRYVMAAREMPQASYFGGPIRPVLETPPPWPVENVGLTR